MNLKIRKFGKFKLLKPLAKGGMAEIFLGVSGNIKNIHKFVVVKRILLSQSHNAEFNKMFQNEGKIAANLNHSNICSIHEFGVAEDQYFICMEYVAGRNLRQLMKKLKTQKKQIDVVTCAHIIKMACSGLDYAHNCTDNVTGQPIGIIHRDISPQNIMVSFSGDVKVIDFGIAKVDDSEATRVGVLKGKCEYMSPEQAMGKEMDRRTDVFSLGVVLWELLAGKKLFTGTNEIQILKKIRDCQVPDIRKFNSKVPEKLAEILDKALSANKNIRYQTAAQMEQDLSLLLNKVYSDFTRTRFNEFIKQLYVEEIVEERKNLKIYSQALVEKKSRNIAGRHSRDSNDMTSTFIGYQDNLKESADDNKEKEGNDFTDSITEATGKSYTETGTGTGTGSYNTSLTKTVNTQSHAKTASQQITRTEFDDPLEGSINSSKNSIIKHSDGYRNDLSFGPDTDTEQHTLSPKYEFTNKRYRTKLMQSYGITKKRKKSFVRQMTPWLAIFAIGGFLVYSFQGALMNTVGEFVTDVSDKKSEINKKIGAFQKKESGLHISDPPSPPKVEKKVEPERKPTYLGKPAVNGKSIFILTKPSGAKIYLDNKQVTGLTPASVVIPSDRRSRLTLKRRGYLDKKVVISPKAVKQTVNFSLTRIKRKHGDAIIIR